MESSVDWSARRAEAPMPKQLLVFRPLCLLPMRGEAITAQEHPELVERGQKLQQIFNEWQQRDRLERQKQWEREQKEQERDGGRGGLPGGRGGHEIER